MYIFKNENEIKDVVKNALDITNDSLDVNVDLSFLEMLLTEENYVNESLIDSKVFLDATISDPSNELCISEETSIYADLSDLIEIE